MVVRALAPVAVAVAVAAVLAVSGCAAHVQIDPPPPASAPHDFRAAYYDQHAPLPASRGELKARTRSGEQHATFERTAVDLNNGAHVVWVEDLRPLVDAKSETGKAIDDAVDARGRADLVTGIGVGVVAAGLVVAGAVLAPYVVAHKVTPDGEKSIDPSTIGAGVALGAGVLIGAPVIVWGSFMRDDEQDARAIAFKTLDASLKQKLGLAGEDLQKPVP
ncbi:MAG TPA: hypothetical protein VGO62_01340 [Myxococcota bacterium]|jgi:hypothetical protein